MTILGSVDISFTDSRYYTWITYADDDQGLNISISPAGKQYMGIAYNKKLEEPSLTPSDYSWSRITSEGVPGPPGSDGQTLYTWIKYADSSTTGMSDSPANKTYIGIAYNKDTQIESENYSDYSWSLIKGADSWRVEIISTNGNIFKNDNINTTLYARVYNGDKDVTDNIPVSRLRWTRVSDDAYSDNLWNQNHFAGITNVVVTSNDVKQRATFNCQLLDENLN